MKKTAIASMITAFVLAGAVWIAPAWTADEARPTLPYDDAVRVAEGKALYAEYCASCHGANLEGQQPNWQDRDADGYLPAPPHDASGHTWHHDNALLMRIVREGTEAIVGGTYKSNMIGFGDVLTDDEIASVLGYIKSTWPAEIQGIHNEINTRVLP
ncbi:c-type cytochrome [Marivita sp.]|uniref:c-type cytochrome n=1 Tax=Marivita sp. TaxID=2003365 RepID=UPI00260974F4|nr:c-type cytochrome [Marivita sp.]